MTEPTLTAHQVATIQTELRASLGLPPEAFPLSTVIGMVGSTADLWRRCGVKQIYRQPGA